ncbi:conserved hypothetical protein [Xanthomonas citri pv. fuscans]|nr:conserved hypothetical protein [Xanthomonas citri pv. fuscans]
MLTPAYKSLWNSHLGRKDWASSTLEKDYMGDATAPIGVTRTLTPTPLPGGEGLASYRAACRLWSPLRSEKAARSCSMTMRAVLECKAESTGKTDCKFRPWLSLFELAVFRRSLTPTPLPTGEGLRFSLL